MTIRVKKSRILDFQGGQVYPQIWQISALILRFQIKVFQTKGKLKESKLGLKKDGMWPWFRLSEFSLQFSFLTLIAQATTEN